MTGDSHRHASGFLFPSRLLEKTCAYVEKPVVRLGGEASAIFVASGEVSFYGVLTSELKHSVKDGEVA